MISFIRNNKGQTLVEAATALGVASIIIAAIAIAILTSMDNAVFSKNQNLATQYAQQAMDILRQQADSSWDPFSHLSGDYCLPSGTLNLVAGTCTTPNIGSVFIRKVNIEMGGAGCSAASQKATIAVAWSDGKCSGGSYCHVVKLDSCFAEKNTVNWP